jgi:uncharacterized protein YdaU (DUF1376 family)
MHYYPHHIGDFIKDTSNLNDHQLATYLRMIWSYYASEKPYENDCERIAFAMRSDAQTVGLILQHYFNLVDGVWRHSRCDRELDAFHGKSEKSRAAANARWKNAKGMRPHSECNADVKVSDANQEPRTNNQDKAKSIGATGKRSRSNSITVEHLSSLGVDQQHAKDWITARKAPLTKTALDAVVSEAAKAGITLAEAVRISAERGWRGFKAEWYQNLSASVKQNGKPSIHHGFDNIDYSAGLVLREDGTHGL